nr:MAG: hypothetical protein BECKLPF1236C_GA0070990_102245 [Candidatus Kentron sp. LPFa]
MLKNSFDVADALAQASAIILDYRVASKGKLSEKQATDLESCEDHLDAMVALFRARGIRIIGKKADKAAKKLETAIKQGQKALKGVQEIKDAIKAATAVVDLAVAVLARDAKGIITAIKNLNKIAALEER